MGMCKVPHINVTSHVQLQLSILYRSLVPISLEMGPSIKYSIWTLWPW